MNLDSHLVDEILEAIWNSREDGTSKVTALNVDCPHDVESLDLPACITTMSADGLVELDGESVQFTKDGEDRARNVIRRHRLAQRLLMDVLDVSEHESEEMACKFEHILSEEVTDKVDAFLGYPTVDPNGKSIPPGAKRDEITDYVRPLIQRMTRLGVGQHAKVAFMTPSFHKRFDRLAAFGINPGAEISLHQRKPAYVLRLGETELALDPEIAAEIFVRPID